MLRIAGIPISRSSVIAVQYDVRSLQLSPPQQQDHRTIMKSSIHKASGSLHECEWRPMIVRYLQSGDASFDVIDWSPAFR